MSNWKGVIDAVGWLLSVQYHRSIDWLRHEGRVVQHFQRSGKDTFGQIPESETRIQRQSLSRKEALVEGRESVGRRETEPAVLSSEQEAAADAGRAAHHRKEHAVHVHILETSFDFNPVQVEGHDGNREIQGASDNIPFPDVRLTHSGVHHRTASAY